MPHQLALSTYALVGSSVVTSNLLFSVLGSSFFGITPLLNGSMGKFDIRAKDRVGIWAAFFKRGAAQAFALTAANLICSATVWYTHPSAFVRKLSLAGAIANVLVIPCTAVFLMPTNNELNEINDTNILDTGAAGDENPTAKSADRLLAKWEKLHNVRYINFVSAWALALAALVMDNRA